DHPRRHRLQARVPRLASPCGSLPVDRDSGPRAPRRLDRLHPLGPPEPGEDVVGNAEHAADGPRAANRRPVRGHATPDLHGAAGDAARHGPPERSRRWARAPRSRRRGPCDEDPRRGAPDEQDVSRRICALPRARPQADSAPPRAPLALSVSRRACASRSTSRAGSRPTSAPDSTACYLNGISCASELFRLSWLITMKPRLGVWPNSVASSDVCSVTVWFGLTTSNMPVLNDGVNALNFAVPVVSVVPSPNARTQYVNLGFAADRHGDPEAQSWLIRT